MTLLGHWPTPDLPEAVNKRIAEDWLDVLAEYPVWAIQEARKLYLKRAKSRPKVAHIVELCKQVMSKERVMLSQCHRILMEDVEKEKPVLSEAEREANKKKVQKMMQEMKNK